MAASGLIDPTKPGKYPVILSDALLGKPSKETYTGIRYNHRPTLSSDTAPDTARLRKSAKDESYNLGFDDQGDKYQYNGVRTSDDGNYVLIFDPTREAFVLHRVDSTFHMNITRTPTESDPETLRKQFPPLEVKTPSSARQPKGKVAAKASASKAAPTKATDRETNVAADSPKTKGKKSVELTLPDVSALATTQKKGEPPSESEKKSKRPALSPVESEDDDEDDDDAGVLEVEYPEGNPAAFRGVLEVEYPDGNPAAFRGPLPASMNRRFSEFVIKRQSDEDERFDDTRAAGGYGAESAEEEGDDEGGEYDEDDEARRSPSPPRLSRMENPPAAVEPEVYTFDDGEEESNANDDEALEAELSKAFEEAMENGGNDSDGSVSEEE
ncbi:hypothetical protein N657DRAFT_689390 [Parathielavia appendiculata]|uniref:Transcription elongation factor Eaf N-terminal domain-containing protein n=1 Tax=Parathielavia appendiculata TaxID=2587402 RepID=A0AAN6Z5K8_9PEZI|nr:hypothetical protein N657DRAFT_689390 [Parathielavia appendiculata]